jgi:hypothetical protein
MQIKDKRTQIMADSENKKAGPPRIALGDYKAARNSLARILRMYFRKELDTEHFRNLCYGLNVLLSFDKFEKESQLEIKSGRFVLDISAQKVLELDRDGREKRILELLQKTGYEKEPVEMETPIPQADIPPVPTILELPEQPQSQPRRLRL